MGSVQLVMSNFFGQNAPAIAAAEAEYEQMWAQDVAAMAGYHAGASAAAAQLSPPLQSLNALATRLAGVLGLSPVTNPVPGNPDLMSQTTQLRQPAVDHVSRRHRRQQLRCAIFSTPLFTATLLPGPNRHWA